MPSGSSKDLVFRFHALLTIDERGNPYGEASTDPETTTLDGHLSRNWKAISANGYGIAPITFEVRIPEEDLEVDDAVIIAPTSHSVIIEDSVSEVAEVVAKAAEPDEEKRVSWDDEDDWDPEGDKIPVPRMPVSDNDAPEEDEDDSVESVDESDYEEIDFGEAFDDSSSIDEKFGRFLPNKKEAPPRKTTQEVSESLQAANFSESDDLVVSIIGESQES